MYNLNLFDSARTFYFFARLLAISICMLQPITVFPQLKKFGNPLLELSNKSV